MKLIKHKLNHEVVILDSKTTVFELFYEIMINFLYGFLGNITTVFIMLKNPYLMGVGFFFYYSFLSVIINRDKYETNFGKYFLLPVSAMSGAMVGCYLAFKLFSIDIIK